MGWKKLFGGKGKALGGGGRGPERQGFRRVRFEQMEQRALLSVSGSPLFALSTAAPADTTDLGYVDYREISAGDHTYQLTTRHAGVLTAELDTGSGIGAVTSTRITALSSASADQSLRAQRAIFLSSAFPVT